MTAQVLTSLPTPAAMAPTRGATTLGQGSGVPIQGFSALLNAAQTPVQIPAQTLAQTPVEAAVSVSLPASVDLLSTTAAVPAASATAPAPAIPAPTPPAVAVQPFAAPVTPSGLDTLTEAQSLPEITGTEATEAAETGTVPTHTAEAGTKSPNVADAGTEATEATDPSAETTALPDPTTPQIQPAIAPVAAPVAAQVAQPMSEPETADKPDLTETPEASEAQGLAAPALPIAAPLVPSQPTALAPTAESASALPALGAGSAALAPAETAASAPAETAVAPTQTTAEGNTLAAPQPALPSSASAPLATAPLPQTLDLAAPQWPEQMVQDIRHGASANLDTLTITLTPERLGPLNIRLETQDGVTHVHIVTETPEAARAIAEAQPRLAEAMARAGLEMGNQSTTTAGGSGTASGFGPTGGDANPRGNDHPGTEPGAQGDATAFDDTPAQPLPPRASARSSIDLIA